MEKYKKPKALIIEDHKDVCTAMARLLATLKGYEVATVGSLREARQALAGPVTFQLIICDGELLPCADCAGTRCAPAELRHELKKAADSGARILLSSASDTSMEIGAQALQQLGVKFTRAPKPGTHLHL